MHECSTAPNRASGEHTVTGAYPLASDGAVFMTTKSNLTHPYQHLFTNKPLHELLSANFSSALFKKPGADTNIGTPDTLASFYLNLYLEPQTKEPIAKIGLLPIGLHVRRDSPLLSTNDSPLLMTALGTDFDQVVPLIVTAERDLFLSFFQFPYDRSNVSKSVQYGKEAAFKPGMVASDVHLALRNFLRNNQEVDPDAFGALIDVPFEEQLRDGDSLLYQLSGYFKDSFLLQAWEVWTTDCIGMD